MDFQLPKYKNEFNSIIWHYFESKKEYWFDYHFDNKSINRDGDLITTFTPFHQIELTNDNIHDYFTDEYFHVDDLFLTAKPFVELGYPLKGSGYVTGLKFDEDKIYAEVILTSAYLMHVYVEVNSQLNYEGGRVKFPPTPAFETVEKRERYLLKDYKHLANTKLSRLSSVCDEKNIEDIENFELD